VFIGNISRKGSEFVFNSEATISGQPGVITMCLYDNDNKFSKDTQRINLKPGECGHLFIISQGAHSVCLCNQTSGVTDCNFIVNVLDLPFASFLMLCR